ncbi:hypothetical protein TCAL_16503 [Tigriopus californicus]|uniref:CHHC U11-48K-type domain-containing protein n=1 Tax=Tigriopus californicus TaxID=6832 RepID=A0A553NUD3_TIGCA|nr:hypothetical protein TCAL_16503 [Tigriopus californicus]
MSGGQCATPQVEKLLPCPFVPSHFVRPGPRFQRHLERCRKECLKLPNSPFYEAARNKVPCNFDQTHFVWAQDMEEHLAHCDGAIMVVKSLADLHVDEEARTDPPAPPPPCPWGEMQKTDSEEEDWDRDQRLDQARGFKVVPYDPKAKVQQEGGEGFLLVPQGKSRSERIAYRRETRLTAGQTRDETASTASSSGSTYSSAPFVDGSSTSSSDTRSTLSQNNGPRLGPCSPISDSETGIGNGRVPSNHARQQAPPSRGRGRGRGRGWHGGSNEPGPSDLRGRARNRRGCRDWANHPN